MPVLDVRAHHVHARPEARMPRRHAWRRSLLAALLAAAAGCTEYPLPIELAPEQPPVPPPTEFPPLARPGVVYMGRDPGPSSAPGRRGTTLDRYVIHDDGTFAYQYLVVLERLSELKGTWVREEDAYRFTWPVTDQAGDWRAVGVLAGDSLRISYSVSMSLSEFEDAIYVRLR